MAFPCPSSSVAPAAVAHRQCWASKEFLAVVGLSEAAPTAFFRGENSSSLLTSNATKFLHERNGLISRTDTMLWPKQLYGEWSNRMMNGTLRMEKHQRQIFPSWCRWVWWVWLDCHMCPHVALSWLRHAVSVGFQISCKITKKWINLF